MTDADTLTRMLHAVDRLDWDGVRACFAGQLRVDYTELNGFDATQHLTGPVLLTESNAVRERSSGSSRTDRVPGRCRKGRARGDQRGELPR